ncbi:integration host factor subunit beta [Thiocystis violacea]|uniref:integration host factor subunit beta n=1 Tax=Thiocystis violacea TaxID=13725 RepID=UPI00190879A4|nr:integration host factor subunit beta [Thiocystis violacea]MBK1725131.1 integration host factor subunit beta [Thiocystis violacea]
MTRTELIAQLANDPESLPEPDIELAVKALLERMTEALARGERIEIRGFGSFTLNDRPPRLGRHPKTGETVAVPARYVPHFKPGKELRERVDLGMADNLPAMEAA